MEGNMPFVSSRPRLHLSNDDRKDLERIRKSRTEPKHKIDRATILLLYADQITVSEIARRLNTNRPKVERTIDKALEFGALTSLVDLPRVGSPGKITSEAKAWLISLACQKPKDIGLASEFWTMNELARYAREHCKDAGYESLIKIRKGTVSKILSKSDVKPHKMSYYTMRKDPDFDKKMIQVLHIYKEVNLLLSAQETDSMVAYLSYDEKPGMQAIENIASDLPPVSGKYAQWKRDREYKRHGTLSLLAGIDLSTGKVYGEVHERHRSREFVEFLKNLDRIYPQNMKIKMILDNHSSHISKETQSYLKTIPGRFEFIFTPTHASWLNIIEMFFSKMARSFLRGIRVSSKNELKERILRYLDEVNKIPTIFRWKWKMDEISIVRQMNY
jgi:transposase